METGIEISGGIGPSAYRGSIRPVESYLPPPSGADPRVRQLLAEYPIAGDAPFGCYLIADSNPYSDIARAVECDEFDEFFGNDPAVMTEAYARYEAHSLFLLVIDREAEQACGTLRIIEHSESGLKTLN